MIACEVIARSWTLTEPFEIAGRVFHAQPVIVVTLRDEQGHCGRGEAAGVDYSGETVESMMRQIRALAHPFLDMAQLQRVCLNLPAGGARNALDCAMWDLHAKQLGTPAWQRAGLKRPMPLKCVYTIGLGSIEDVQRKALQAREYDLLKVKVDAERHVDQVRAVRAVRPDARIMVDANQGWTLDLTRALLPQLRLLGVEMVEQPLPQGQDEELRGLNDAMLLATDESCTTVDSLERLVGCYQMVNIKLDKTGGLTEALRMAQCAKMLGLEVMVGNMCGSSLAMAPAALVGQLCRYVDLDGPLLQIEDCEHGLVYRNGCVEPPEPALWG